MLAIAEQLPADGNRVGLPEGCEKIVRMSVVHADVQELVIRGADQPLGLAVERLIAGGLQCRALWLAPF